MELKGGEEVGVEEVGEVRGFGVLREEWWIQCQCSANVRTGRRDIRYDLLVRVLVEGEKRTVQTLLPD